MRIAIVFSSPTPRMNEFENVWEKCPDSRELDSDKLVIEGGDWKVFVFDGLNKRYYDGPWNIEAIKSEITGIIEDNTESSVGILLHGTENELNLLMDQLRLSYPQRICHKLFAICYTSSQGTFYRKYLKPFSADGSDAIFEQLWTKIANGKWKDEGQMSVADEVHFLRHRLSNILTFMKLKANTAKNHENKKPLLEFEKFDIDNLLMRYKTIENELIKQRVDSARKIPIILEEINGIIDNIKRAEVSLNHALKLSRNCLNKVQSVYQIFLDLKGFVHD